MSTMAVTANLPLVVSFKVSSKIREMVKKKIGAQSLLKQSDIN